MSRVHAGREELRLVYDFQSLDMTEFTEHVEFVRA